MSERREWYICWKESLPSEASLRDKPMAPNALKTGAIQEAREELR
jgi:hypothetical protein